jgi:drug/metabolite transporter (DMT)-like permease
MVDGFATGTIVGNLFALANSLLFACFIVALRSNPGVDMLPVVALGALISASIAAIAAPDLHISMHDLLLCFLWGAVVQCTALSMTVFAAQHLPAAELCLLALIESVLAPVWVWIFLSEVPGLFAVLGGAIVVLSVALWSATGSYRLKSITGASTPLR